METQQIPCPFCGTKQDFTFHPEVNVSAEPDLKAPVLDGSIFEMTCVHCGRTARIGYPIRYTDPQAGIVLYLCGPEDDGQDVPIPADSRLVRIVRAPWELAEKIIAADSGLDDRTLQITKQFLASALDSSMSVHTERMVLVGTEDGLRYHVEAKEWDTPLLTPFDPLAYQSVSDAFSPFYPTDPRSNLTVDAAWAGRLLQPDDVLH